MIKNYNEIIKKQTNVKNISLEKIEVKVKIKPNFKTLGPKFGKNMKQISRLLALEPPTDVAKAVRAGHTIRLRSDETVWDLGPEDIVVKQLELGSLVYSTVDDPKLILDAEITDELRREGCARDLVRHIQQLRKDMDMDVQNHIEISWKTTSDDVRTVILAYQQHIQKETLCDRMINNPIPDDHEGNDIKLGNGVVNISLRKLDGHSDRE